ncbi:cysteine desulfurase [Polaribacter sp.]|nr:cysteine desulfurase [Polaribacter sp.]
MKTVYLDNAATTKVDETVIETMQLALLENFGNPSSTHRFGRKAKTAIENARKNIAKQLNVTSSEIIFTSGGTEADNLILHNAILNLGVKRIISSKIEHHAVLHTCEYLAKTYGVTLDFVDVKPDGTIDMNHFESLLKDDSSKTLVSLMWINNEIGNILDINTICELCKKYDALFHSDTVQVIGHYPVDLQQTPIDFLVASAHKFHGCKGVGFAYFKKGFGIKPMIHGGSQEKGARSSTENVHAILGMEKALTLANTHFQKEKNYIESLKVYFISELKTLSENIDFNGLSSDLDKSTYSILNVRFPISNNMLLFSLDLAGIGVSGGSACQSGSNAGSHVLNEILDDEEQKKTSVRFSFSKYTTKEDLDYTIDTLKKLIQ